MATATEIRAFFQQSYLTELKSRLREAAEEGELESTLEDMGSLMNGVDEIANRDTKDEFGWRSENAEMDEALEQPECYEGIDFTAIIEEARQIPALA